jgi:hypothetical protein
MQKIIFILLISVTLGCTKSEVETLNEAIDNSNAKILFEGKFINEVHPTSGTLTITEGPDGKRMINVMNLMSDNGPDLRLYIAENKDALNFIDIVSKPKNGTYSLLLPNGIDFTKHKYALIWCKRFSVLFGSAEIK